MGHIIALSESTVLWDFTFLCIVIPCREVGGLTDGILHAEKLLLLWVVVLVRVGQGSNEVGFQHVVFAEEELSLLVQELDLLSIYAGCLPSLAASNTE